MDEFTKYVISKQTEWAVLYNDHKKQYKLEKNRAEKERMNNNRKKIMDLGNNYILMYIL